MKKLFLLFLLVACAKEELTRPQNIQVTPSIRALSCSQRTCARDQDCSNVGCGVCKSDFTCTGDYYRAPYLE